MQKLLPLSVALCLSFTGCQIFEKSKTWDSVTSVRPGDSFRQADPSAYYAEKLHQVLLKQGVEHYVVTYQYHYSHRYEEVVGKRTAIVYRDQAEGRHTWWLKDEGTATPVWLPDGDLDAQISFYCHRDAEVVEAKHYRISGDGKEILVPHRFAPHSPTEDSTSSSRKTVTRDERLEKLFRIRNGTSYDPASAIDRRKMEQLKH